jgi:hypothetical protein
MNVKIRWEDIEGLEKPDHSYSCLRLSVPWTKKAKLPGGWFVFVQEMFQSVRRVLLPRSEAQVDGWISGLR